MIWLAPRHVYKARVIFVGVVIVDEIYHVMDFLELFEHSSAKATVNESNIRFIYNW